MTVIWILLKLVEKAPVHYRLATTASLAPINIAEVGCTSSQRFKNLDDNLPVLKKVTHTLTDNSKFQSEEFHFIKITKKKFYTSIRKNTVLCLTARDVIIRRAPTSLPINF